MFLDYFALGILAFSGIVVFYGIIVIHDIPYEIAEKRNHPHKDALHVAGWVSLFTLHVLWPFLWIWATLWREDRGWGFVQDKDGQHAVQPIDLQQQIHLLGAQVHALETEIKSLNRENTAPDTETNGKQTDDDAISETPVDNSEDTK